MCLETFAYSWNAEYIEWAWCAKIIINILCKVNGKSIWYCWFLRIYSCANVTIEPTQNGPILDNGILSCFQRQQTKTISHVAEACPEERTLTSSCTSPKSPPPSHAMEPKDQDITQLTYPSLFRSWGSIVRTIWCWLPYNKWPRYKVLQLKLTSQHSHIQQVLGLLRDPFLPCQVSWNPPT